MVPTWIQLASCAFLVERWSILVQHKLSNIPFRFRSVAQRGAKRRVRGKGIERGAPARARRSPQVAEAVHVVAIILHACSNGSTIGTCNAVLPAQVPMRRLRIPRDGDVRFWPAEPGCSIVLKGVVERDVAMVARVGAAQLYRHRWIHHHLATALARANETLILDAALHVTTCADSH